MRASQRCGNWPREPVKLLLSLSVPSDMMRAVAASGYGTGGADGGGGAGVSPVPNVKCWFRLGIEYAALV
jgi:hypothetical protein